MDERLLNIATQRGVFLYREAIAAGYDDQALRRAVRSGRVHKVRHGSYTFGPLWAEADAAKRHKITTRAVLRTAKTRVVVSHTSSIVEHTNTFWDLDLGSTHITREDGRGGRRAAGVAQHRGRLLPEDVTRTDGIVVTSPTRAALEITTVTDLERSLVVVNGLLHEKLTTPKELRERYDRGMAFWPNSLATDLVLRLADPRLESVGETRSFVAFWRHGIPRPEPQFEVYDERGNFVARVDFAWPDLKVYAEFDGKLKYTKLLQPGEDPGDVVFREKAREDLVRRVTGWICVRITWADLMQPEALAAKISRAFAQQAV